MSTAHTTIANYLAPATSPKQKTYPLEPQNALVNSDTSKGNNKHGTKKAPVHATGNTQNEGLSLLSNREKILLK